ncbi:hypothetical protein G9A89_015463 [Geosiphon pyriformis]|nr:hypothetical protein G9A89_015463 [Geosiphon pyriformis]
MVLDSSVVVLVLFSVVPALGFSSLKILMTKVDCLEFKLVALEVSIGSVLVNYLGAGVMVIINSSLAKHVCKISEMPGWLLSIKLLFKNKLSVSILGLYTGVFWQSGFLKLFKGFDDVFTKESLRFHKLELLVSKIVKALYKKSVVNFDFFIRCWISLDNLKALVVQNVVDSGVGSDHICSALFGVKRSYCAAKLAEFLRAKEANIRFAIDKRIESFKVNKSHIIRNVLEYLFCKVVLDHLIVNDELILKPDLVKSKMDVIMKSWTRKHRMIDDISGNWYCQYQSLEYVFNKAFFGVMCSIEFDELSGVVSNLPNGKTTGLLGAWISIIPKPYKWKGVLMNTYPIVLIKMACKIFSKILSNRISLACSTFDVFYGDNFLVLKNMMTQFSIFAIGLVIENTLKKKPEALASFARHVKSI